MTTAVMLEASPQRRAGLRPAVHAEWAKITSLRSTTWALLATFAGTLLVSAFRPTARPATRCAGTQGSTRRTSRWRVSPLARWSSAFSASWSSPASSEQGPSVRPWPRYPGARTSLPPRSSCGVAGFDRRRGAQLRLVLLGWAVLSTGGTPTATLGHPDVLRAVVESVPTSRSAPCSGSASGRSSATRPARSPPSWAAPCSCPSCCTTAVAAPADSCPRSFTPTRWPPSYPTRLLLRHRRLPADGAVHGGRTGRRHHAGRAAGRMTTERGGGGARLRCASEVGRCRSPSAEEQAARMQAIARRILREPFTKRPWSELAFYFVSGGLAVIGLAFVGVTMVAGSCSPSPSSAWPSSGSPSGAREGSGD